MSIEAAAKIVAAVVGLLYVNGLVAVSLYLSRFGISDISLLSMAFPNIIGMVILSGAVAVKTREYVTRLKAGEMTQGE